MKEVVDKDGKVTFEYAIEKNSEIAKNLKGHLMLIVGEVTSSPATQSLSLSLPPGTCSGAFIFLSLLLLNCISFPSRWIRTSTPRPLCSSFTCVSLAVD